MRDFIAGVVWFDVTLLFGFVVTVVLSERKNAMSKDKEMTKVEKAERDDRLRDAREERHSENSESLRDAIREDERAKAGHPAEVAKPKAEEAGKEERDSHGHLAGEAKPGVTRVSVIEDGHTVIKEVGK